ncbi:ATP-binding protein [Aquimarina sp. MMG016]|uniref:AAA family ATPase n=1 Tax=Aquimarina sp. MMG016 TaxID=2822690 RepID=UPI001B3A7812|nr:ATP-binding protein [Aquimarina sp. MMG016]MBQ4822531.1 ATP-binding protein [Aquimarina sp. MMG016]
MTKKRVVITGAPGTGKTSVIVKLEQANFFCFHEIIRTMTQEAKNNGDSTVITSNPIVSVSDPYKFNLDILNGRIQQFNDAEFKEDHILFYDRGIPDVLAYMDYFGQSYKDDFKQACKTNTYDHIFLLPPWKEIYVSDEERYESFEQAQEIHNHLLETYSRFGYQCIEVPFGTVKERNDFILKNIK